MAEPRPAADPPTDHMPLDAAAQQALADVEAGFVVGHAQLKSLVSYFSNTMRQCIRENVGPVPMIPSVRHSYMHTLLLLVPQHLTLFYLYLLKVHG